MKLLQQIATLVAEAITRLYRVVDTHKTDTTNPHRVTKAQVGLDRVDNTADRDKPLSTIQQDSLGALNGRISEHTGNGEIHKTSAQIRSEITDADIPASIARNAEISERLAAKVDKQDGKQLMPSPSETPAVNKYLSEDGTWKVVNTNSIIFTAIPELLHEGGSGIQDDPNTTFTILDDGAKEECWRRWVNGERNIEAFLRYPPISVSYKEDGSIDLSAGQFHYMKLTSCMTEWDGYPKFTAEYYWQYDGLDDFGTFANVGVFRAIFYFFVLGHNGEIITGGHSIVKNVCADLHWIYPKIEAKVGKEEGKGLSSNDYTDDEKAKLGRMGTYVTDFSSDPQLLPDGKFQVCLKAYRHNPDTNETLTNGIVINEAGEATNGLLSVDGYNTLQGLKSGGVAMNATGTPSATWHIGVPSGVIAKSSGGTLEVRTAADAGYADMVVNGLTVKGDMVVDGESFVVNSQTVETADNLILLNKGEVGAGVTKGVAGLEIDRGTADRYKIVFDESDDRFKAGAGTDLWPILLRDKDGDLTGDSMLVWDTAAKRAKTGKNLDAELAGYLPLAGGTMASGAMISVSGSASGVVRDGSNEGFVITSDEVAVGGYSSGISVMTDGSRADIVHHVPNHKYKMWDEGNDGSDSGLDADLLDGRQGAEYALKSEIPSGLALGETASTAYRGDRGKIAYDYSQSKRSKADLDAALQGEINNKVNTNDSRLSDARPANGGNSKTVGDGSIKMYVGSSNEINFGGTNLLSIIYFGVREMDGKPLPNTYIFGNGNGTATIKAGNFMLSGEQVATTNQIPMTLPASDVSAWAKAATKPRYEFNEIFLWEIGVIPTDSPRRIILLNSLITNGYLSHIAIGTIRKSISGWGRGLFSIGTNDAGTSFTDFEFDINGRIYSPAGTFALTSEIPTKLPADGGNAETLGSFASGNYLKYTGELVTVPDIWDKIEVVQLNNILPDGLDGVYAYGTLISLPGLESRFQLYAPHRGALTNVSSLYFRTGFNGDKKDWRKVATIEDIPNVFTSSTAPTSGMKKGDIWIKM